MKSVNGKLILCLSVVSSAIAQSGPIAQRATAPVRTPTFEVASVRQNMSPRVVGFYGQPGGRAYFSGHIKMLVQYAFNLQDYQVTGGPEWIDSQWFDINAVPPEDSPSRNIKVRNAEPSPEQRLMIQSLLSDRFGLKYHFETEEGNVFILTRGKKPLQFTPPKDPESDPRAIVLMKPGGIDSGMIYDGEAIGTNTTTDYLALRLSRYLQLPVLNETGITGSYDFHLPADDPENRDPATAVFNVVSRLGLKIKRERGPIQSLVIDHIEQPSEN